MLNEEELQDAKLLVFANKQVRSVSPSHRGLQLADGGFVSRRRINRMR